MRRRQIYAAQVEQPETVNLSAPAEPDKKTCPKCGRDLPKRGGHFHVRACKA